MINLDDQIGRYRRKGILPDTNLMLLFLVGQFDPTLIARFKRTQQFNADDFILLNLLLEQFEDIVTTPNILTEVSNLSGQLRDDLKSPYFKMFAEKIVTLEEHFTESQSLAKQPEFVFYGLTDIGIAHLAKDNYLVLTDDLRLSVYLKTMEIDVINFNHLRDF